MKRATCVALMLFVSGVASPTARTVINDFDSSLAQAMGRMDAAMKAAPMDASADHNFLTMMIPHHQGAVDMAKSELQYGHDTRVKRLAQEIIITQQLEIQLMQSYLANSSRLQRKKN